jgi:hypothetical protein
VIGWSPARQPNWILLSTGRSPSGRAGRKARIPAQNAFIRLNSVASAFALDAGPMLDRHGEHVSARLAQRAVARRIFAALCERYPNRYVALVEQPGNASLAAAAQGPSESAD